MVCPRLFDLNELQKNIAAAAGGSNTTKPTAKSEEPKLIIRHFQLADATVEANVVPLNKKYTLKLPTIELRDLGGKNGATPSEISRQVLDILTQRSLAAVKQAGIDEKVQAAKTEAREKVDTKKRKAESRAKDKLKSVLGK